jgi:hypothetical protein
VLGGVGFRETALPVIVHVTDASSHVADDYAGFGADAHDADETIDALEALGARVVVIWTNAVDPVGVATDPTGPLGIAMATGADVPVCAFADSPARADGSCADTDCCTGIDGAGVAPVDGGTCPLVFRTTDEGSGLDASIVAAIDVLTQFLEYDLTVAVRDDATDPIDTRCFVDTVGVSTITAPTGACAPTPTAEDTDGDTVDDTVQGATPRTQVRFEVAAVNQDLHDVDDDGDTTEACGPAGAYRLYLDLLADGATVVATRRIEVVVP